MNLKIREFKMALENFINKSEIPHEVKQIILKELYINALTAANDAISSELDEREGKENKQDE